ncbi:MAG: hypothetical protein ACERJ2_06945 [Filomicrobium sp.]
MLPLKIYQCHFGELGMLAKRHFWTVGLCSAFVAIAVLIGVMSTSANAQQSGRIQFTIVKAGLVVGGQFGSGKVHVGKKVYPITVSGLGVGYTFGASVANLKGTVSNFKKVSDISGKYTAVGGSGAYVVGVGVVKLTNSKGVVVSVAGPQAGLEISINLSGMVIAFD